MPARLAGVSLVGLQGQDFMTQVPNAKQVPTDANAPVSIPTFGRIYGDPSQPSFITETGTAVWMWRKGQRVRFFTSQGVQVGPEHANVFPAMCSAFAAGWIDPNLPTYVNWLCQVEAGRFRTEHSQESV